MSERTRDDNDDAYLWDGAGAPTEEIVRLERTLGVLRHRGAPLPALTGRSEPRPRPRQRTRAWLLAAAAAIVLAAGGWVLLALRSTWSVSAITGVPSVAGKQVSGTGRLARGEWLVTDNYSRARIAIGQIGSVDVEPNTRLQLVTSGRQEHRMALDRGTIHARIWAPPRFFYVNTDAAVAVDLGCAYTLHVDDRGDGLLRVTRGWVGFEREGRETYVPEGAICATRGALGPGTPRYEDAPSGYGEALLLLDFGETNSPGRRAALEQVLAAARRRDAMTLWHLLSRGTTEERALVYDRLAQLVPPPAGATRDQVLSGHRIALNRWWDALGVDVSTWWRLFKKTW